MGRVSIDEYEEDPLTPYESKKDSRAVRKNHRHCPVCKAKLKKIGKGTRYERQCSSCNATLAQELHCSHCGTYRVWRGPKGIYCHGCGKEYAHIFRVCQQTSFTGTARSAARSSLCFVPPINCSVMRNQETRRQYIGWGVEDLAQLSAQQAGEALANAIELTRFGQIFVKACVPDVLSPDWKARPPSVGA